MEFRSRFVSPPENAVDVMVRFSSDPAPGAKKAMARILIAEDDDIVRAFLVRALGGEGHDLTETADGSTALDALNASNGKFDLLLSDVKCRGWTASTRTRDRPGNRRNWVSGRPRCQLQNPGHRPTGPARLREPLLQPM